MCHQRVRYIEAVCVDERIAPLAEVDAAPVAQGAAIDYSRQPCAALESVIAYGVYGGGQREFADTR